MSSKNEKPKKPTTQPATQVNPPADAASPNGSEPRKRNYLSPQKALAIAVSELVALLDSDSVSRLLTNEEKKRVRAAAAIAEDLNSQTIKPIQARISEINTALAALTVPERLIKPETVKQVQQYANELARLQKRLDTIMNAAALG